MKRMFACLLFVLGLPIITASLQGGAGSHTPFAPVALAGHTLTGGFCQCGCPGCMCDPGEEIDMCLPDNKDVQQLASANATRSSGPDVPAAALFLGTGLLILQRLRK